jgi:hypothetical protein
MRVDRLGTGVEALLGQLFAELDDLVFEQICDPCGRSVRSPGSGLESRGALGAVAGAELVEPTAMHAVGAGEFTDRCALLEVPFDQVATQVHRRLPAVDVSDVLTHVSPISWDHTPPPTPSSVVITSSGWNAHHDHAEGRCVGEHDDDQLIRGRAVCTVPSHIAVSSFGGSRPELADRLVGPARRPFNRVREP